MIDFSVYLITDRKLFAGTDTFFAAVRGALEGGIKAVQLREKDLPVRELLALSYKIRELTGQFRAKLFINDRADVALSVGADGVHLGQAGIPAFAVRKITGKDFLIGVSTHSLKEAHAAEQEGADFITFGPLYQTPSKLKYGAPVGLGALKQVAEDIALPVFGIGGIKSNEINAVMNSGADGIAVISGILGDAEVKKAAEHYLKETRERR